MISIFQDREGHLWFGTKDGVSRYEPSTRSGDIKGTFTTFTAQDGLGYDQVMSIFQDREGNLWFGTEGGGVSRYDGDVLTTFTTRDGLADVSIGRSSILQDREGYLWFGTQTGGMSRFDPSARSGHAFTTFTTRDGLANNQVTSTFKDRDGNLWFGTGGRGVSRYDGTAFTTFTTQDGLAASQVSSIFQDREGYLWFGTSKGVTRYRTQAPSPPPVSIHAVVADHRYVGESEISIPSSVKLAAFEFGGISFKTRHEAMFYRYRLKGYDQDWKSTHSRRVEYEDLPRGSYNFEVKAVDRDLVPSERLATVALIVHLPYERILWLSALSIAVLLVALQAGRVIQRDRRLRETNLKLDESNRAMSSANKELFEINKALQLAKKQAERERAEDRVRAEIATMRESTDLQNITPLIWKELADLDVGFSRCGVFIIDEEKKQISLYLSTPQGKSLGAVDLDLDTDHPPLQSMVDHWRKKEVFVHPWDAQAFLDWMQFLQEQGQSIEPEEYMDGEAPPELLILHTVPFSHGMLYVGSPSPLPEEDLELVKGLAGAFSVAYARYLDFQRLEERNRQLAEANREVEQANKAKSAFLANMSHELRTPLNSVIAMSDILLEKYFGDLTQQQEDYAKDIRESGQLLLSLINDILDLSKVEAGHSPLELSEVDLKNLLEGSLTVVRERALKHGISLSCEVAEDLPTISGDGRKLKQAIYNLLSNAVKFTPDQGKVGVDARLDDDRIRVCVWDTGIGIPPEDQEKVFGEFEQSDISLTRKYEGTGLGLALVKRFVEQHGGGIWLESKVGEGSRFCFTLPLKPPEEQA